MQKKLSLFDATMLVMGGIIGVGIFFKPHELALELPETWAYFTMWVVGAVAALAGAMTFAELAGSFPKTGGWYVFLREGFGGLPSFLFAWIVLLVISTGASAGVADFGAEQIEALCGLGPGYRRWIAAGLIVAITGVALFGVKAGAVFQNLCMVAKLLAIGTFVFCGLALFQPPAADLAPVVAATIEPTRPLVSRMISATLPVLFTYGGWQLITYIAPSVKDPQRTLPKAIVLGVAGVGVVYLLLNAAYVRVLGMETLANERGVAALLAERTLGDVGARFLNAGITISAIGFLVATLIATPGIYVAMARERLFLESVGRLHPRTGAPVVALLIQAVMCLAYLGLSSDVRDDLGDSVVFAEWIFHCLVGLALLRVRRTRPELERPFRSPAYPFFPLLYVLFAAGVVLGNLKTSPWSTTRLGLVVLAVGAIIYVPWRRAASARRG